MHQHTLPPNGKVIITLKEAAEVTGIPAWTLRRHIYERKLACIRPGGNRGKILITPSDLHSYLLRYGKRPVALLRWRGCRS